MRYHLALKAAFGVEDFGEGDIKALSRVVLGQGAYKRRRGLSAAEFHRHVEAEPRLKTLAQSAVTGDSRFCLRNALLAVAYLVAEGEQLISLIGFAEILGYGHLAKLGDKRLDQPLLCGGVAVEDVEGGLSAVTVFCELSRSPAGFERGQPLLLLMRVKLDDRAELEHIDYLLALLERCNDFEILHFEFCQENTSYR